MGSDVGDGGSTLVEKLRSPMVWGGGPGTKGQHAFYQLIHQGTAAWSPCRVSLGRGQGGHEPELATKQPRSFWPIASAQSRRCLRGRSLWRRRRALNGRERACRAPEGMEGQARHRVFPGRTGRPRR